MRVLLTTYILIFVLFCRFLFSYFSLNASLFVETTETKDLLLHSNVEHF